MHESNFACRQRSTKIGTTAFNSAVFMIENLLLQDFDSSEPIFIYYREANKWA
jgi:hypothetical protein